MYRQMQEKTAAKSADGREAALQSNKRAFYVLKFYEKSGIFFSPVRQLSGDLAGAGLQV